MNPSSYRGALKQMPFDLLNLAETLLAEATAARLDQRQVEATRLYKKRDRYRADALCAIDREARNSLKSLLSLCADIQRLRKAIGARRKATSHEELADACKSLAQTYRELSSELWKDHEFHEKLAATLLSRK